jgi:hypothetical protein
MINRRQLLATVSACILAFVLSSPIAEKAAAAAIAQDARIQLAFDTLELYRFDLAEQSRLLGVAPDVIVTNSKDLHHIARSLLLHWNNEWTWQRVDSIVGIREVLDKRFGKDNIAEHRRWLLDHQPIWRYTCYDMLQTGSIKDLNHVADYATLMLT